MDALAVFEQELRAKRRARSTRYAYLATARRFLAHLEKSVREAQAADVSAFLDRRRGENLVAWRRELSHLRAFFRALVEAGWIDHAPTDALQPSRRRPAPKAALGLEAVATLLEATGRDMPREGSHRWALRVRDRATLELLFAVGLRASEACSVRVTDLDLGLRTLRVRPRKRGKARSLPLPAASIAHLRHYQQRARPVLARHRDGRDQGRLLVSRSGRPLDRGALGWIVSQAGRRAGLHVYPHALRRSLATGFMRAGASIKAIQHLLGHRSLAATDYYLSLDMADLRRAVESLHDQRQERG